MGTAYLVGAGPGDPKLLTRRGAELLARADVVLHDALIDPGILGLARRAEIIDVGRRAGESRWLTQERINRLLVELARRHAVVVRLKGGDPLVFGRGGEEALALARAGIPFEIVPGVTAGVGALAHAGIPLTHRGVSTSAVFVTAHDREDPGREAEWRHIAGIGGTVVVYMGGGRIRAVTERLIRFGRAPETPAAVVESGTLPTQRVVEGRLDEIAERAGELTGPALIVIGDVARLREGLAWIQPGPLAGRTVLVARARAIQERCASWAPPSSSSRASDRWRHPRPPRCPMRCARSAATGSWSSPGAPRSKERCAPSRAPAWTAGRWRGSGSWRSVGERSRRCGAPASTATSGCGATFPSASRLRSAAASAGSRGCRFS